MKSKLIQRLVASATSALLLLSSTATVFAEEEKYSYSLNSVNAYDITVNDTSLTEYTDIPAKYNNLPVDVSKSFGKLPNVETLEFPDVPEFRNEEYSGSYTPYKITAASTTGSTTLKKVTIHYQGHIQLLLRKATALEEVYLYCKELTVKKANFGSNNENAVYHVISDSVKQTLVDFGISEEKVIVDLEIPKDDPILKIRTSTSEIVYNEGDISVTVDENSSGTKVWYEISASEGFGRLDNTISVGEDSKLKLTPDKTRSGTYYIRARSEETNEFYSGTSNVVKFTINNSEKQALVKEAYDKASSLWIFNQDDYTTESMNALKEAYNDKFSYTFTNLYTEQEFIDVANEINKAIDNLVKIDITEAKNNLYDAIDNANKLISTDYTVASWTVLSEVLTKSTEVYNNDESGAASIATATDNLNNAISELVVAEVGKPKFDVNCIFSNAGWWPQYDLTESFEGNGTHTFTIDTSEVPTTEAFVFVLDIVNGLGNYPDMTAKLDSIKADGVEIPLDSSKILYGDQEGKGNYRIDIYNEYTETKNNPPIDPKAMKSSKLIEITFTINGLPDTNLKTVLETLIKSIESKIAALVDGDYTQDSIVAVNTAIADAKVLLEQDVILQSELDNATAVINNAFENLTPANTAEARAELNKAIESAEALNESDYTAETWKVLSKALKNAKSSSDDATISELKELTNALNNAISALEKASDDSSKPVDDSDSVIDNDSDNNNDPDGPVQTGLAGAGISVFTILSVVSLVVAKKRQK